MFGYNVTCVFFFSSGASEGLQYSFECRKLQSFSFCRRSLLFLIFRDIFGRASSDGSETSSQWSYESHESKSTKANDTELFSLFSLVQFD